MSLHVEVMQVIQLQQSNAELLGQLSMAEQGRHIMLGKITSLRDKCALATAENSSLKREVTSAHATIAVRYALIPCPEPDFRWDPHHA